MIETNLVHADLINYEPMLENHLHEIQVDHQETINTAYKLMIQDIKNQNLQIRRLCKKLWLQETAKTVTAQAYTGAESKEDRVERMRWVINVSSLGSGETAIFRLQGRNKSNETYKNVKDVQVNEKGIHKFLTLEVRPNVELEIYKYYRIQKTDSASTVTFKSYLVEQTYENLHLWRSLSLAFTSLIVKEEDIFSVKAQKYYDMYMDYLVNNKYFYDSDDDEEIDEVEAQSDHSSIIFLRG